MTLEREWKFLEDRSLDVFIQPAEEYLKQYPDKILFPVDLAYEKEGKRVEVTIEELPIKEGTLDIGERTIEKYKEIIAAAGTLFMNGPAGVYEDARFEKGTKEIAQALGDAKGYSLIGGGDTVTAIGKYVDLDRINYVCTAGGAMVRYLSGIKLPLIEAMEKHGK